LANEGAKGLSHLKVDREAGVPDGSASYYFRTKDALLLAVTQRMADVDHAVLLAFVRLVRDAEGTAANDGPSALATLMIRAAEEPHLTRTKARYELMLEASRNPTLAEVLAPNIRLFTQLHREIVMQLQPAGVDVDPTVLEDQIAATMAFINGVGLELAVGDRSIHDAEQIDRLLAAILNGVVIAHRGDELERKGAGRAVG